MPNPIAIVYYSHTGNTEQVARVLSAELDAATVRIRTLQPMPHGFMSYVVGGFQAKFGVRVPIQPVPYNFAACDTIFLGMPTWAGTCAPAIRGFLASYSLKGKRIALFTTYGGSRMTAIPAVKSLLADAIIIGEIAIPAPFKGPGFKENIITWARTCVSAQ
jgi:flavodoxin